MGGAHTSGSLYVPEYFGGLRRFSLPSGQDQGTWSQVGGANVRVHPGGRVFVANGSVIALDGQTGAPIFGVDDRPNLFTGIDIGPTGDAYASGAVLGSNPRVGVIGRFDAATGQSRGEFFTGPGEFWSLQFVPPECSDGRDNDGDGRTDFQASASARDFGCIDAADVSETGTVACDDGADNDGDGRADYRAVAGAGDIGCLSHRTNTEAPQCQDGLDNDAQPGIDFDGGASVNGGVPLATVDPQCTSATGGSEAPVVVSGGCGIGPELAFFVPLLARLRFRRRRARYEPKRRESEGS
jgi:hypothetical protein